MLIMNDTSTYAQPGTGNKQGVANTRENALQRKITELLGCEPDKMIPIQGDASARAYYRICFNNETRVVMVNPQPVNEDSDPFILIDKFLASRDVPVPAIHAVDPANGIIVLDDLGDVTLESCFISDPDYTLRYHYAKAMNILEQLQSLKPIESQMSCPAFGYRFDAETFYRELLFFQQHFLESHLNISISRVGNKILRDGFQEIASILEREPLVFSHRDFHSRNFMIKDDTLFLIDFQDARLGLREYDLVSILRDAYVKLPEDFIETQILRFQSTTENIRKSAIPSRQIFSLMCIQRNLKAMGTFGYQAAQKQNRIYLKYVSNLKSHLKNEFLHLDSSMLNEFRRVLFEMVRID